MRDPYEILGVAKSASEAEIKKAFRGLAKKHHPDKHAGDKDAQKKFQEISGAYDILGDKDKRTKFDAGEIDAAGNPRGFDPRQGGGFQGGPFGGGGPGGGARDFHFTWDNAEGETQEGFRAEDLFSDLFGGLGGRGRRGGGRQPARGEDFTVQATVSFDEAVKGGTRRVMVPNGEQIDLKIPAGVKDGQQLRVKGRGGAGRNGGPPGDILIDVSVAPHPSMTRDGNDIRMDLPVTLREAVLGGKVPVTVPGGGTVELNLPANSNTGKTLRLKGKGVAAAGGAAGDLYVRLVVTLPDHPDAELTKFAEGWKAGYDPRAKK